MLRETISRAGNAYVAANCDGIVVR
jgi:hypothetical protein